MRYLPLYIDGTKLKCLVVGGGKVASRKLEILSKTSTDCCVLAPELSDATRRIVETHHIRHIKREYLTFNPEGFDLVVCATDDATLNERVSLECREKSIFVNVVDSAELSSAIFPAIVDRDPVTIAISTSGSSPSLARNIRKSIEKLLPVNLGLFARFLQKKRMEMANHSDDRLSVQQWDAVIDSNIAELVYQRNLEHADEVFASIANDVKQRRGLVSLVGAGPGDPDLLTIRAARCIEGADVVYYDNLVSEGVMDRVRRDAERVYVGKKRNFATVRQEVINQMLAKDAIAGKRVVRLKGGDPFLFGRGGEEIESLAQQGITFEVVPGITAALGCAAYANIPLTHRNHAQSVRFVTGHLQSDETNIDWPELAKPMQTLVVYMGLAGMSLFMENLLANGVDPKTPVAVISRGTLPEQRVVRATVENIAELVTARALHGPTTTIIGGVAQLGVQ